MKKLSDKNKKTRKSSRIFFRILVAALILIIVFCLWRVVPYFWNTHKTNADYAKLASETVRDSDRDTGKSHPNDRTGSRQAWKKVRIDFRRLRGINPDIRAWLRFDHTDTVPVNYPVLFSGDNDTYLHHDIYKNYAYAGCLFLEESNTPKWTSAKDMSKIIYGHNMRNGSMFGSLKKYRREDLYCDNSYFTLYTPKVSYRYRIFSYFNTATGSFVYRTGFTRGTKEYRTYLKSLRNASLKDTGSAPSAKTPVLILSTCVQPGTNTRFVVCGELVCKNIR